MEREELLKEQAAERAWLLEYSVRRAQRDWHIRRAASLYINVGQIAALLDMSRQHVSGIVNGTRSTASTPSRPPRQAAGNTGSSPQEG